MKYEVLITARAQQEAQASHDWWAKHRSVKQATRWYDELVTAIVSLSHNPDRFALAVENDRFPYEIRQLNLGIGRKPTHRIVFVIRTSDVVVLRVRHVAQQAIEPN